MELVFTGISVMLFSFILFLYRANIKKHRDVLLEEEVGLKAYLNDYCDVKIYIKGLNDFSTSFQTARVSIYDKFFAVSRSRKILVYGKDIIKVDLKKGSLSAAHIVVSFKENSLNKEVFIYTFFPERMLTCIKDLMDRCGEKK